MKKKSTVVRLAAGVALAATLLLVWIILAVGIIGASGDSADLMYGGVLAVGLLGSVVARLRPRRMAHAMVATAVAQVLVGVIALGAGMVPAYNSAFEILGISGFFTAMWLGSAWLFRKAAETPKSARATVEV